MNVLGVVGSLRRDSHNRKLLRAVGRQLPPDVQLTEYDRMKLIPPFDEDDEASPAPEVLEWRRAIDSADAVLFATPEYNSSIPGQLKNAVDWASRPKAQAALRNKPVAVIGASMSMFGGLWSQAELRKVLSASGARVLDNELAVATAHEAFDGEDQLIEAELGDALGSVVEDLADAAQRRAQAAGVEA